jgi:hypothetical protein
VRHPQIIQVDDQQFLAGIKPQAAVRHSSISLSSPQRRKTLPKEWQKSQMQPLSE